MSHITVRLNVSQINFSGFVSSELRERNLFIGVCGVGSVRLAYITLHVGLLFLNAKVVSAIIGLRFRPKSKVKVNCSRGVSSVTIIETDIRFILKKPDFIVIPIIFFFGQKLESIGARRLHRSKEIEIYVRRKDLLRVIKNATPNTLAAILYVFIFFLNIKASGAVSLSLQIVV